MPKLCASLFNVDNVTQMRKVIKNHFYVTKMPKILRWMSQHKLFQTRNRKTYDANLGLGWCQNVFTTVPKSISLRQNEANRPLYVSATATSDVLCSVADIVILLPLPLIF